MQLSRSIAVVEHSRTLSSANKQVYVSAGSALVGRLFYSRDTLNQTIVHAQAHQKTACTVFFARKGSNQDPAPVPPAQPKNSNQDSRNSPYKESQNPQPASPPWPTNRQDWQSLSRSFAQSPDNNYGETRGDRAVINWALAWAETIAAAVVTGFPYEFLDNFATYIGSTSQDFTHAYYTRFANSS